MGMQKLVMAMFLLAFMAGEYALVAWMQVG
jgi:hypothetical protein